jgi:hypothetical protein
LWFGCSKISLRARYRLPRLADRRSCYCKQFKRRNEANHVAADAFLRHAQQLRGLGRGADCGKRAVGIIETAPTCFRDRYRSVFCRRITVRIRTAVMSKFIVIPITEGQIVLLLIVRTPFKRHKKSMAIVTFNTRMDRILCFLSAGSNGAGTVSGTIRDAFLRPKADTETRKIMEPPTPQRATPTTNSRGVSTPMISSWCNSNTTETKHAENANVILAIVPRFIKKLVRPHRAMSDLTVALSRLPGTNASAATYSR